MPGRLKKTGITIEEILEWLLSGSSLRVRDEPLWVGYCSDDLRRKLFRDKESGFKSIRKATDFIEIYLIPFLMWKNAVEHEFVWKDGRCILQPKSSFLKEDLLIGLRALSKCEKIINRETLKIEKKKHRPKKGRELEDGCQRGTICQLCEVFLTRTGQQHYRLVSELVNKFYDSSFSAENVERIYVRSKPDRALVHQLQFALTRS